MRKFIGIFILIIIIFSTATFAIQFLDLGNLNDKLKAIRAANLELLEAKYYKILDNAALNAAKQFRYKPGTVNNRPVRFRTIEVFVFSA